MPNEQEHLTLGLAVACYGFLMGRKRSYSSAMLAARISCCYVDAPRVREIVATLRRYPIMIYPYAGYYEVEVAQGATS
jgi:hypothetical protein